MNTISRRCLLIPLLLTSLLPPPPFVRSSSHLTATFLKVVDGVAAPTTTPEISDVSLPGCGMRCFKEGISSCLGFQWKPLQASWTSDVTTASEDSSSANCTRASVLGSNSTGPCHLLKCVPSPSSLVESKGSQMYFFRGKGHLTYGSFNAPPSYKMGCSYAYKIFDKVLLSYSDAEAQCKADGAELMIIRNKEDQELVDTRIVTSEGYWFGLTDRQKEGVWIYHDGSAPTYTNWDSGQPNNFNKEGKYQNCAMFFNGKWNDNQCSTRLKFICQKVFLEL